VWHLIDIIVDDVVYEILYDGCRLTPLQRGHQVLLEGDEGLGEGAEMPYVVRRNTAEDLISAGNS
jgi:hypothetical protein